MKPPLRIAVTGLKTLLLVAAIAPPAALAHHSAALFYDMGSRISITGVVTRFNFRNPHAIVEFEVTTVDGMQERWTAETAAPSALRRRGWKQDSLVPGETITLEGVQARDGSHFMRITKAIKADGTEVGVPRDANE